MEWQNELGNFASALGGLYSGYQSYNNANNTNNQVQGLLGNQQQAAQQQLAQLQQQAAAQRAAAEENYRNSTIQVGQQNQGLQGNIDTMTSNLNALSDPNSPYMQMARQGIERKDAASGRRSQWGEREVQLTGTLADYVGKYAPGINNSISNARGQIATNNNSLANIFNTMNNPNAQTNTAITNLLNGMNGMATSANTTGRSAANSANNQLGSLLQQGIGGVGGLMNLFGNSNNSSTNWGGSNTFDWNTDAGGMGALNSLTGLGSNDIFGLGNGYFDNSAWGTESAGGDPYNGGW